jgi:PadR family transcriptional regulator, regulatory protein PadR
MTNEASETTKAKAPFRSPRLHGELLATSLLAFLRDWNAHGYELAQRLAEAGLPPFDVGTIYRTLRQLEKAGLVSSLWDTSESGPAKRTYSLTAAGDAFLSTWMDVLRRYENFFGALAGRPPAKATEETPGERN